MVEVEKGVIVVGDETLNDRLAAIGQMSAGIAHEIRNPLTTVKGFLQLLKEEHPHQYWDYVFPELDQAISTVQNLLQVSKPNLDNEPYSPISLCAELETMLYLFQNQVYNVNVQTEFWDKEVFVFGKKSQIKKAIFNILKNAFEAIDGSGTITIGHHREGNFVCLSIADTGSGIEEDKIKLLGTPFFTTKDHGVGMGLTQAYAAFYENGAEVEVISEPRKGTKFMIKFPIQINEDFNIQDLGLQTTEGQSLKEFFALNKDKFNELLLSEASEAFELVKKGSKISKTKLLDDAHQLIDLLIDGISYEIISLAKERGTSWAKSDLPIASKLTWFQGVRSATWRFLNFYYSRHGIESDRFFSLERRINYLLDSFVKHFFVHFTKYRDSIIRSQRELIDELSVPVIPIAESVAVIPLVGTLDTYRAKRIQENVLTEISKLKLHKIVIDLSGVAFLDSAVVGHLFRIVDGIKLLGCRAVLTGIRPEIANTMIEQGIAIDEKIEIYSTLRQAVQLG